MAKKKAEAAPPVPMKLYKVLTADGHSPYVDKYAWSLPTQREDGSWEPGAWHEESQKRLDDGYGLHITTTPTWHRSSPPATVYECEVVGCQGDPETERDLAALRVRLLRPVSWDEAARVSEEWERGRHVRQAKAEQKEHMDKIRKAAIQAQAQKRAEREAGVESPALTAFRMMVELTPANSWRNINGARYSILKYATEYLDFDPDDVRTIHKEFDGGILVWPERRGDPLCAGGQEQEQQRVRRVGGVPQPQAMVVLVRREEDARPRRHLPAHRQRLAHDHVVPRGLRQRPQGQRQEDREDHPGADGAAERRVTQLRPRIARGIAESRRTRLF